VIRRIHVRYGGLQVSDEQRETINRVVATHAEGCPVARSLKGSIEITTSLEAG
jgi:uncharacterized OsmC-like protein